MPDITGTANYATFVAAKAAFDANMTRATGLDWGHQLCICIEQAGGDPGLLKGLPTL